MNAYEELKAWCEKHLPDNLWTDTFVNYTGDEDTVLNAIDIQYEHRLISFVFNDDGSLFNIDFD